MLQRTFFLIILVFNKSSFATDFSYKGTVKESMSKYHRINHIETYLSSMNKKMQSLSKSMKTSQSKADQELKNKINKLGKDLSKLSSEVGVIKTKDIPALKKSIADSKNDTMAERLKEQDATIAELKNELASLQVVLKSLVKAKKVDSEIKKRNQPLKKKKSP
jgi:uncharacterized coiled-coil protein SlyX